MRNNGKNNEMMKKIVHFDGEQLTKSSKKKKNMHD